MAVLKNSNGVLPMSVPRVQMGKLRIPWFPFGLSKPPQTTIPQTTHLGGNWKKPKFNKTDPLFGFHLSTRGPKRGEGHHGYGDS